MDPKDFLSEFDRLQAEQKRYFDAFETLRKQFEDDFNEWIEIKRMRFFTENEMTRFDKERPDKPVIWPIYLNLKSAEGPEVNLERQVYLFALDEGRLLIQYPVDREPEDDADDDEPQNRGKTKTRDLPEDETMERQSLLYGREKENSDVFSALMEYFRQAMPPDAKVLMTRLAEKNGVQTNTVRTSEAAS